MKILKIGILPREQFQKRVMQIAAGQYKPKLGEPKVWFSSIRSLSEVLSDNNVRLLKLIEQHKPQNMKELAKLSGRQPSNLSRTLKTLARYGIVQLRKQGTMIIPHTVATQFRIEYAL